MEINLNPEFGGITFAPPDQQPSTGIISSLNVSQLPGHVGGNGGSCDSNGTDEYKEFYETAQFVTGLIIYPLLCVTGITGNSLSLIVLSHKDMATSTNIYLLALGISDSLKLMNDFLYFVMLVISQHNPTAANAMMVNVYPYAHYVFQVAVSVTAWLTVSVAMDRYISVCYPSHSKSLCTIPKARTVVISVNVIMILLSIPSGFRYRLQTVHDLKNNVTCMELVVTELGRNRQFMIPYTWVQNFLRGIIPVFILVFINARIINVLRKERVRGKKFSSRNRITLMLIAMVVIFILCITPDAVMSTFFGKGYVEEDYMVKGIREITDSLVAFNSAVNFILYCSLSAIFRNTFMRVFFGRRYAKMRGGSCRNVSRDGTSGRRKSTKSSLRYNHRNSGSGGGGGGDDEYGDEVCDEDLGLTEIPDMNGRNTLLDAVHNNIRNYEGVDGSNVYDNGADKDNSGSHYYDSAYTNGYRSSPPDLDKKYSFSSLGRGPEMDPMTPPDLSRSPPHGILKHRSSLADAVHVRDAADNKVVLYVFQDSESDGVPL